MNDASGVINVDTDDELREQMERMATEVSERLHGDNGPDLGGRVVLVIPFDPTKPETAIRAHKGLMSKALPFFLAALDTNDLELLDIEEWNVHIAGAAHNTETPVVTIELKVQRRDAEGYAEHIIIPNAERIIGKIRDRAQEESADATKQ